MIRLDQTNSCAEQYRNSGGQQAVRISSRRHLRAHSTETSTTGLANQSNFSLYHTPIVHRFKMRGHMKVESDVRVVNQFFGWARVIQSAMGLGKQPPDGSRGKLMSFVLTMCRAHRDEMLHVASKGGHGCIENHHYLYTALRMCYELRHGNTEGVGTLLREIFLCEGSLQAIFSILQPHHNSCVRGEVRGDVNIDAFTLYTGQLRYDLPAFEYFVRCITVLNRDSRESSNNPFTAEHVLNTPIDELTSTTPLMAAIMCSNPNLVLLLLRMGADPLKNQEGDVLEQRAKSPVQHVIDSLNITAMLRNTRRGLREQVITRSLKDREEVAKQFLEFFARAAYALDIRQASKNVDTSCSDEQRFANGIFFEVSAKVAEMLQVQTYRRPPPLLHACRCVIRRSIFQARKESVFRAVKNLPIPLTLQTYLDLKS